MKKILFLSFICLSLTIFGTESWIQNFGQENWQRARTIAYYSSMLLLFGSTLECAHQFGIFLPVEGSNSDHNADSGLKYLGRTFMAAGFLGLVGSAEGPMESYLQTRARNLAHKKVD